MTSRVHYRFGPFDFDTHSRVLRRDGEVVPLPPQPARVLHLLLDHAGSVVLRTEIQERIWPDTGSSVTPEQGLNAAVASVRRALGERASSPRYVETLPRRGYRFRAPVEAVRAEVTGPRGVSRGRHPIRYAGVAAAVLMATVAVGAGLRSGGSSEGAEGEVLSDLSRNEPSPAAVRAYRSARRLMSRASMPGVRAALPYLERAVGEDPTYAPARGELALAYYRLGRPEPARAQAKQALEYAAEPRAHAVLARLALERDFDWAAAETHARRAAALAPDRSEYQTAVAHHEVLAGRTREGLRRLEAVLRRDSVGPLAVGDVGRLYYWAGDYELALRHCERSLEVMSLEVKPRAERCRLDALRQLGSWEEAVESAGRLMTHAGAERAEVDALRAMPAREGLEAFDRWSLRVGNRRTALGGDSSYRVALVLAGLGRRAEALEQLERAARARDPSFVTALVEPRLAPLHGDPRFEEIVRPLVADRRSATAQSGPGEPSRYSSSPIRSSSSR